MKAALLGLLSIFFSVSAVAQSMPSQEPATLGRLFMTPDKRANLDRQRKLNITEMEGQQSDSIELNGVVQRSSGNNSIWINRRMQYGHEKQSGIHLRPGQPAAATIEMDKAAPVELQVGDSLNRSTQERKQLVPPDAVHAGKPR